MKNIKEFTLEELINEFEKINQPQFRAKQIFQWMFKKGISSFSAMKNLPNILVEKLENAYSLKMPDLVKKISSKDGSVKLLFRLYDRYHIETVIIPAEDKRRTICISTQVGCKSICCFCASGKTGFKRNLNISEILDQILYARHILGYNLTNYVFMGMGEPLDNYDNLISAIKIMNDPLGMDIGARRITISTCGIVPAIDRLGDFDLQVNLSISLNAADDNLRNKIMPINKRYPIKELLNSCKKYIEKKGRIITLEYILMKGVNDSLKNIHELAEISKDLNAKVNLIGYNVIKGNKIVPVEEKEVYKIQKLLKDKKVKVTVRASKGGDICAACGQLAGN